MANSESELEYARGYLPMWAGPPRQGGMCARLLVNKQERIITTIDFDERAFISLGRSTDKVTYSLDHPSISRLHALIVHHQRLQAFFLIDCGSAHGTYLAGKRIEPKVPVRIAEGTTPSEPIHFGGSSRVYVLQSLALDGRTEINTQINRAPLVLDDDRDMGGGGSRIRRVGSQTMIPLHNAVGDQVPSLSLLDAKGILPSIHQVLGTGLHHPHGRPTLKGSSNGSATHPGRGVLRVGGSTKSPPPEILKTPLLDSMERFHPAQRGTSESSQNRGSSPQRESSPSSTRGERDLRRERDQHEHVSFQVCAFANVSVVSVCVQFLTFGTRVR